MKNIVPLLALGALLAGCADVPPPPPATQAMMPDAIFQADTAQTPDHIVQCVLQAYQGRSDIHAANGSDGARIITASSGGAPAEIIAFTPTTSGTHVEVHQAAGFGRDLFGFIKQARVCGAMSGS